MTLPPPGVTIRDSSPADAGALARCIDTVSRERRYLGSVTGFGVEPTRAFIAERGTQAASRSSP